MAVTLWPDGTDDIVILAKSPRNGMGGGVRDRPPISGKPPIGLSFIIYKASAGYRIKFLQAAARALSVWQDTMGHRAAIVWMLFK